MLVLRRLIDNIMRAGAQGTEKEAKSVNQEKTHNDS